MDKEKNYKVLRFYKEFVSCEVVQTYLTRKEAIFIANASGKGQIVHEDILISRGEWFDGIQKMTEEDYNEYSPS